MQTILVLASVASFFLLAVGLISPETVSKWCKLKMTRLKSSVIFFSLGVMFLSMANSSDKKINTNSIEFNANSITSTMPVIKEGLENIGKPKPTTKETPRASQIAPKGAGSEQTAISAPQETPTQNDAYADIRKRAHEKWPTDKSMENYEYKQQVEAYEQIRAIVKYPDILERAKEKWPHDYTMQLYEYKQQKDAFEEMGEITQYPEIKTRAQEKWPKDYQMQVYEYKQQKSAYEEMLEIPDSAKKREAQAKWPTDYQMQVYEYNN